MKISFISDLHWGHKNFSKKSFHENLSYFTEEFFPYVIENTIKDVILSGDLMHNRNIFDNFMIQELKEKFFFWFDKNNINLHIIVGNHDTYYKNRIDYNFPKTNLKEFDNIFVYDKPTITHINNFSFGFLPWLVEKDDITKLIDPKDVDILIGHFDINSALMQGNTLSNVGYDVNVFKRYKVVLSGHYHATSDIKNVKYIGSPYQMNYRDYGNKKGFWVMDETMKFEYIENNFSPKFLKLFYFETEDGDIRLYVGGLSEDRVEVELEKAKTLFENNYFKFIVKTYKDQDILQETFRKLTEHSYDKVVLINEVKSIEDFDIHKFEQEIDDSEELIDIITGYVDNLKLKDSRMSKRKINKILNNYYLETKEGALE